MLAGVKDVVLFRQDGIPVTQAVTDPWQKVTVLLFGIPVGQVVERRLGDVTSWGFLSFPNG